MSNVTDPGNAPAAGDELTCSGGTWTGSPVLDYQWLRSGMPIGGATATGYTVLPADEGKPLQCGVTAATSNGATQAFRAHGSWSTRSRRAPRRADFPPNVSGTPNVGNTLFCYRGEWEPSEYPWEPTYDPTLAYAYQWLRTAQKSAAPRTRATPSPHRTLTPLFSAG